MILSTAMINAVVTLGGTFQNFFIEYTKEQDGSWHVAGSSLPVKEAENLQNRRKVGQQYKSGRDWICPLLTSSIAYDALSLCTVFFRK